MDGHVARLGAVVVVVAGGALMGCAPQPMRRGVAVDARTSAAPTPPLEVPRVPDAGATPSMVPIPQSPTTDADAGACATRERGTPILSLSEIEMAPGEQRPLRVLITPRPGAYEQIPAACRVRWLIPANGHATVDEAGRLAIAAGAPVGYTFGVQATLADGRSAHSTVRVVRRGAGSLVGTYTEVGRGPCRGRSTVAPPEPVRELIFRGDGSFSVTWQPFETRRDYWGTFVHDAARGSLSLRVEGRGNYNPPDLDPEGTVEFEGDTRIRLRGMWLGSAPQRAERPACVQVFERQR